MEGGVRQRLGRLLGRRRSPRAAADVGEDVRELCFGPRPIPAVCRAAEREVLPAAVGVEAQRVDGAARTPAREDLPFRLLAAHGAPSGRTRRLYSSLRSNGQQLDVAASLARPGLRACRRWPCAPFVCERLTDDGRVEAQAWPRAAPESYDTELVGVRIDPRAINAMSSRDLSSIDQRLTRLRRQVEQADDLGSDQAGELSERVLTGVPALVRVHTHVPRSAGRTTRTGSATTASLSPPDTARLRGVAAREAHATDAGGVLPRRRGAQYGQSAAGRERAGVTEGGTGAGDNAGARGARWPWRTAPPTTIRAQ